MKIFIDTALIEEIKAGADQGLLDGVTTNPSLVAKSGRSHKELIKEICELVGDKPVSAEVLSVETQGMLKEAYELAKIHPSVVIKLPLTTEGLKATKILSEKNIKTNVTLCFSPNQALLAAKAGATFVSIFVGRLDDIGHRGVDVAVESHDMLFQYPEFKTQVLAASIRHPQHVLDLASAGIPVSTIPYGVLQALVKHPLTDIGLKKFLEDAKKT